MFPSPLNVTLSPSRLLRRFILALHLIALFAVWTTDLEALLQQLANLALTFSLIWYWLPGQVTQLRCHGDGRFEVSKSGNWVPGQALQHLTLTPSIVILGYRVDGKHHRLRILTDCLDAEDFRRLRLWLRWAQSSNTAEYPSNY